MFQGLPLRRPAVNDALAIVRARLGSTAFSSARPTDILEIPPAGVEGVRGLDRRVGRSSAQSGDRPREARQKFLDLPRRQLRQDGVDLPFDQPEMMRSRAASWKGICPAECQTP
jgi:hypothetical protein